MIKLRDKNFMMNFHWTPSRTEEHTLNTIAYAYDMLNFCHPPSHDNFEIS